MLSKSLFQVIVRLVRFEVVTCLVYLSFKVVRFSRALIQAYQAVPRLIYSVCLRHLCCNWNCADILKAVKCFLLVNFHVMNCAMLILLLTYNEGKRKTAAMLSCLNGNKNGPPPWHAWLEKAAAGIRSWSIRCCQCGTKCGIE